MSCPDHEVLAYFGRRVFSKSIVTLWCSSTTTAQAKIPPKLPFSLLTKVTSREDSEAPGSPLNNIRCLTHWWRNNPQLWLIAPPQPLSTTCPAWLLDHLPFWGTRILGKFFAGTLFVNNERSESPPVPLLFVHPPTFISPLCPSYSGNTAPPKSTQIHENISK